MTAPSQFQQASNSDSQENFVYFFSEIASYILFSDLED